MEPWWLTLLAEQRAARFEAFSGATASIVVPISDVLITDIVSRQLPTLIRELELSALAGNELHVAVRLRNPAWFPRINLKLAIDRQPQLPDAPILVLRLLTYGTLASLAGPVTKFLNALPSWIRLDGDRLRVDLAELLRAQDAADALTYFRHLNVTTKDGAIVVAVDAQIP